MSAEDEKSPEWVRPPAELVQRFGGLVAPLPGIEARKMFGYPSAFFNGHLFAGIFADRMFVRLPPERRAELLALDGALPLEPMAGRPMREYVLLPRPLVDQPGGAAPWLDLALAFAASLPPKEPKPKRKGGR